MRVLSVASELFPLVKTGGLADVAGALPPALEAAGSNGDGGGGAVEVRTLLPAYPAARAALPGAEVLAELPDVLGFAGRLLGARLPAPDGAGPGLALLLLDLPALFDRPGGPYVGPDGRDWPDNALRFGALARVAADLGLGRALPGWRPDIVHAHDWQAGLAPAYLALDEGVAGGPRPATVQTVHNLAFQGWFEPGLLGALRLPPEALAVEGLELHGGIGFLKAGLYYADRLTTVSPTYAREIRTPGGGMGLHGLLRTRAADLVGIVNGLDTAVWDPARDPHLPLAYGPPGSGARAGAAAGKAAARAALSARLGLDPAGAGGAGGPLFAAVSRLTHQKGLDLVLGLLPEILARGGSLGLLGAGEPALERGFAAAAAAHPGRVACAFGYDEPLAHLLQAGADAILVPSRFEPCGLTQLVALRYGTLPVVARVGGLADTVIDASPAALADGVATGLQFAPATVEGLRDALDRAFELWADPAARAAVRDRGMTREVGWPASAARYRALYAGLLAARG